MTIPMSFIAGCCLFRGHYCILVFTNPDAGQTVKIPIPGALSNCFNALGTAKIVRVT